MLIVKSSILAKNLEGSVLLEPEAEDDMYHLYNLISVGDEVEAETIRNVITENKIGVRTKTRVKTRMTIRVESIDFDPDQRGLRIGGVNAKPNEYIALGKHHTIELELHRLVSVSKPCWDGIYLDMIKSLADRTHNADIAALVLQEGLAHLCLIKSSFTKTCARIEKTLPKKKQGNNAFEKSMERFFEEIYNAIQKNVDFGTVKVLLIGSPGFVKDDFVQCALDRCARDPPKQDAQSILKNKSKLLKVHASSGHRNALDELFLQPEVMAKLNDVKAVSEVRALKNFCDTMAADSDRACYGFQDVSYANEQLAIDELLVSDKIYRCPNFDERNKYMNLMESVIANGGKVYRFSSLHVSGEQLNLFTGIAATLRFPLPDIDEMGAESAPAADISTMSTAAINNNEPVHAWHDNAEDEYGSFFAPKRSSNPSEEEDLTSFL